MFPDDAVPELSTARSGSPHPVFWLKVIGKLPAERRHGPRGGALEPVDPVVGEQVDALGGRVPGEPAAAAETCGRGPFLAVFADHRVVQIGPLSGRGAEADDGGDEEAEEPEAEAGARAWPRTNPGGW